MKLGYRDIEGYAKNKPAVPLVLVYGPDHGLVRERATLLARHITPDIHDPFNVALLSGDQVLTDSSRVMMEASAISMMGGDRLVWVRGASDGLAACLKAYLAAPVPGAFVLVEADELTTKSSLRKLIEESKNAVALPCYIQDSGDIAKTVLASVRAANLRIDNDALDFLSIAIAGDAQQVRSEIDKLLTYMGVNAAGQGQGGTVTYADAAACCGTMGLAATDTLIDALLAGETDRAMTLLKRLESEEGYPMMVLRALLSHGRKIQTTQVRLSHGESLEEILDPKRNPPVFFKRKAAFAAQLRRWSGLKLERLMHDIFMTEMKFKSGAFIPATLPQTLLSISTRAAKA